MSSDRREVDRLTNEAGRTSGTDEISPINGLGEGIKNYTRCCPSSLAKLVNITPISLWFMGFINQQTSLGGTILQEPIFFFVAVVFLFV